jgi:acylphosphatase
VARRPGGLIALASGTRVMTGRGAPAVHIRVRGAVQGVSFRYLARQRATSLGLTGWVRNCPDGSVEAHAQGEATSLGRFVDWMRLGPPSARVNAMEVQGSAHNPSLRGFHIR